MAVRSWDGVVAQTNCTRNSKPDAKILMPWTLDAAAAFSIQHLKRYFLIPFTNVVSVVFRVVVRGGQSEKRLKNILAPTPSMDHEDVRVTMYSL
jgi:hypothetical protein